MDEFPKLLYHYTSLYALKGILDESALEDGNIVFRFCNPLQSNDKQEVNFYEKYVYKWGTGKILRNNVYEEAKNIGKPFIVSLIQHIEGGKGLHFGRRGYPHCEIPMWNMYGDNYKGVRLKFDAKKLQEFFNSNSINLEKCQYMSKDKMSKLGADIRNGKGDLEDVYKKSVLYKMSSWEYENEWRAIIWKNEFSNIKEDLATGKLFLERTIPLECLKTITIGPKADKDRVAERLSDIKKRHCKMSNVIIEKSGLAIN